LISAIISLIVYQITLIFVEGDVDQVVKSSSFLMFFLNLTFLSLYGNSDGKTA
jgi:hypothetical protein